MPQRALTAHRGDAGVLLMLSGIVLTLAFIMAMLAAFHLQSLEAEVSFEQTSRPDVRDDWRDARALVAASLGERIEPGMTSVDVLTNVVPTVAREFTTWVRGREYAGDLRVWPDGEPILHDLVEYDAWAFDGTTFTHAFDGADDGVIWQRPCPDGSSECIVGLVLRLEMISVDRDISEPIVYAID